MSGRTGLLITLWQLYHHIDNIGIGIVTRLCWFVRGRIKEKISTIYAIKDQVYCIEYTVQWLVNTVQLF